jgi:hypothetical protein
MIVGDLENRNALGAAIPHDPDVPTLAAARAVEWSIGQ